MLESTLTWGAPTKQSLQNVSPSPQLKKSSSKTWMAAQLYLTVWTWSGGFTRYFLQRRVSMWQHRGLYIYTRLMFGVMVWVPW